MRSVPATISTRPNAAFFVNCCKSRQTDKSKFPPVNPANLLLLALRKYHDPCHQEHHRRPDCRSEIGIESLDADLAENRSETCKTADRQAYKRPASFSPAPRSFPSPSSGS